MLGLPRCLSFGGSRVDAAIASEILRVVEPMAIEGALEAERMHREGEAERRRVAELDMQQSEYDASLAERRYAACDPENRLVAAQLEKHWESAMTTNAIERLNEKFRRRIKTQTVLPCAETLPMLLWALLAFGHIQMRKVDDWETLSQPLEPMSLDLAA